jgi:hypothetical protein
VLTYSLLASCSVSSPGSTGRSSIPEAAVLEPNGRGVLGRPVEPGDDCGGCSNAFPRHIAPESCLISRPTRPRGRRECRMLAAPASLACKRKCTLRTQATTGTAETPAFPAQWFYGLYVISSVRRAFWPPSLSRNVPRELDPSVGGSGPHDFAVRLGIARQSMPQRPSLPASNVRDDREAPLVIGAGCTKITTLFRKTEEKYFRREGLT